MAHDPDEQYAEHAHGECEAAEDGDQTRGHAETRTADGIQISGPERNGHHDEEDREEPDDQRQDVDQQQEGDPGVGTRTPGNPSGEVTGTNHRPPRGEDRPLEEAMGVVEPRRHGRLDRIVAHQRPDHAFVLLDRSVATDTLEGLRIEMAIGGVAVVGLIAMRAAEADLADLEFEVSRTERIPAFGAGARRQVPERIFALLATHEDAPSMDPTHPPADARPPSGRSCPHTRQVLLSPRDTPRRCVVGTPPPVAG